MIQGLWLKALPSLSSLNNRKVIFMGFLGGANGKEPAWQCRVLKRRGFKLWVRKIPGGGHGYPLHYPCLESPMDRGTWQVAVHRVAGMLNTTERLNHSNNWGYFNCWGTRTLVAALPQAGSIIWVSLLVSIWCWTRWFPLTLLSLNFCDPTMIPVILLTFMNSKLSLNRFF